MPGKHNAGGCGCCEQTDICNNCDDLTFFTVSGLSNANCTTGCDDKNGTYVFRTLGTPFDTGTVCGWVGLWGGDNCGLDDDPYMYIGPILNNCTSFNGWSIDFRSDGSGGIIITVDLTMPYALDAFCDGCGSRSSYRVRFRGTFDDCASASGFTLLLDSSLIVDCLGGGTGDLCDLLNATVSLG